MSESVDPCDLPSGFTPAFVETRDQLLYLANVTVRESGWLEFTEWTGDSGMLPPHQCGKVKFVATEFVESGLRCRVADDDLRRQAQPKPEVSP